eukprot:g4410.t1
MPYRGEISNVALAELLALHGAFSLSQLRQGGFAATELAKGGFSASELEEAGFAVEELKGTCDVKFDDDERDRFVPYASISQAATVGPEPDDRQPPDSEPQRASDAKKVVVNAKMAVKSVAQSAKKVVKNVVVQQVKKVVGQPVQEAVEKAVKQIVDKPKPVVPAVPARQAQRLANAWWLGQKLCEGDKVETRRKGSESLHSGTLYRNYRDAPLARPLDGGRRFRGAYCTSSGQWVAQLSYGARDYHLGTYGTQEEAARACDKAALQHHDEPEILQNDNGRFHQTDRMLAIEAVRPHSLKYRQLERIIKALDDRNEKLHAAKTLIPRLREVNHEGKLRLLKTKRKDQLLEHFGKDDKKQIDELWATQDKHIRI